MALPDIKALKKLALACRSVGITHFKSEDLEFSLSDVTPTIRKRTRKSDKHGDLPVSSDDSVSSDSLTQEQLLMYSVIDPTEDRG